MADENEEERQRLQALADLGSNAMLVIKNSESKEPIGPVAAAILLLRITEHGTLSKIFTVPVKSIEEAQLDIETWRRATTSGLMEEKILDGEPVFVLLEAHHVKGIGVIEHNFINKLRFISQQDPDQWQSLVRQRMQEAKDARKGLH